MLELACATKLLLSSVFFFLVSEEFPHRLKHFKQSVNNFFDVPSVPLCDGGRELAFGLQTTLRETKYPRE
jgi:hypothetical protein